MRIFQFHISLPGCSFPIWRRFRVTEDYRFDRFHQVIQLVMGWKNYHLHEFSIQSRRVGMVLGIDDETTEPEDETTLRLKDFRLKPQDHLEYLYDFGDHWQHLLKLESISGGMLTAPECIAGAGRCPTENSGGIDRYLCLLEARNNPQHPDSAFWANDAEEGFDPITFPIEKVNAELEFFGLWHNKYPASKSTPWPQL
ncbi:plasmid pRiA4b ORF-3 family protein [Flavilitoribacter nigricans]|nr:plasmid pRiA4b ORF-3 family protein [Flavilitoribacter nigricans]